MLSWGLITNFGHRIIFNYRLVLLTFLIFMVGLLDVVSRSASVVWAQSSMANLQFLLRANHWPRDPLYPVSICANEAVYVACGVGIPCAINPDQEICGASSRLCFFGFSVASIIYRFFCLRETKGRTFTEIYLLFFQKLRRGISRLVYLIRKVWGIFLPKAGGVTLFTFGG